MISFDEKIRKRLRERTSGKLCKPCKPCKLQKEAVFSWISFSEPIPIPENLKRVRLVIDRERKPV